MFQFYRDVNLEKDSGKFYSNFTCCLIKPFYYLKIKTITRENWLFHSRECIFFHPIYPTGLYELRFKRVVLKKRRNILSSHLSLSSLIPYITTLRFASLKSFNIQKKNSNDESFSFLFFINQLLLYLLFQFNLWSSLGLHLFVITLLISHFLQFHSISIK